MKRTWSVISIVVAVLVSTGCTLFDRPRGNLPEDGDATEKLVGLYDEQFKNAQPNSTELYDLGTAASRSVCADYLDQLGVKHQDLSWAGSVLGLVGAFTEAALGLSGASAGSISVVGASFGLTTAGIDATEAAYILTPDIAAVRGLVTKAQNEYDALIAAAPPAHRADAIAAVEGFHDLCAIDNIAALVNQAVEGGTVRAFEDPMERLTRAIEPAARVQLAKSVGLTSGLISEELVVLLFWLRAGEATPQERQAMAERLSSLPASPLDEKGELKKPGSKGAPDFALMDDAIRQIQATSGAALEAEIAKRREATAEEKALEEKMRVATAQERPALERKMDEAAKARLRKAPFRIPVLRVR